MQSSTKIIICICSVLFVSAAILVLPQTNAQQNDMDMKTEQRWDTYGCGGTCIPGTNNLAIADVDDDGTQEIVTGGYAYLIQNDTRIDLEAPLRIWSWNGQNLTLEKKENWPGNIWAVYIGDADGDGATEILTAGAVTQDNTTAPALRFWTWKMNSLTLKATYFNISAASISIADLNNDKKPEIATVERPTNTDNTQAQLSIYTWNQTNLKLLQATKWTNGETTRANSVYCQDINNDGQQEIITAGYNNGINNSNGELRIWQFNEPELDQIANVQWQTVNNTYASDVAGNPMGNTRVNTVKVADVDADELPEVLTGGFTYDGTTVNGQLRIWNYSNNELNLEKSQEWTTSDITELKSIAVNDVDNDGNMEIVTSGVTAGKGAFTQNLTTTETAQLRVWSWTGTDLVQEQSKDWIVDEGVAAWQVGTADLNNDGNAEIVTVGCSYFNNLCDPNLRIWVLPQATTMKTQSMEPTTIIAIGTICTVIVVAILFARNKHVKQDM